MQPYISLEGIKKKATSDIKFNYFGGDTLLPNLGASWPKNLLIPYGHAWQQPNLQLPCLFSVLFKMKTQGVGCSGHVSVPEANRVGNKSWEKQKFSNFAWKNSMEMSDKIKSL